MTYLNVDEVDTAVVNLAAAYPALAELIRLPDRSVEGRTCHALRIGRSTEKRRETAVIIGGVHAREWGSCEILLNLAADLLEAHTAHADLVYGGRRFSAGEVEDLLARRQIVVFPLVNPDGRNHSQTGPHLWRKNRNPAYTGGSSDPNCVGVDINRNYDFLFDFTTAFAPHSGVACSDKPCDHDCYHGPHAFSEPETRNVRWLLDHHPHTRWFVDVHSYSEDMLFTWGDDEDQSTDAQMTFHNHAYDGKRGIAGDAYREYIPSADHTAVQALAKAFCDGLQAVRGKAYTPKPGFDLYPTSGTSDDYAYARHIVDADTGKIFGFTVEWGTEFQPPWAEMENIIRDVSAGLIAFCLST